ncbi:MAG TPA: hypothetical protein VL651_03025 [Bacteroidia bacterium]|jgi:hypothetical protein|nr:hypothetical protein [Bacteroidia bacterium]
MQKVTIRKPCYTDLEDMPRIPGGVWCTKCGEKVEDVSKMSDEELVKWIGDNSKHKPCGIYTNEQSKIPFTEKVLMPLKIAAATVSAMFIHEGIHAQVTPTEMSAVSSAQQPKDSARFMMVGKVVSHKSGEGLSGVSIYISNGDSVLVTARSGDDGSFYIELPKWEGVSYQVSFSDWGYRHELFEAYVPCEDLFVVKMKRKSMGRKLRRIFHRHPRTVSKF